MKLLLALVAAQASKTCRHHRRLAAVTFNASTPIPAAAPPVGNTTIALLSAGGCPGSGLNIIDLDLAQVSR